MWGILSFMRGRKLNAEVGRGTGKSVDGVVCLAVVVVVVVVAHNMFIRYGIC